MANELNIDSVNGLMTYFTEPLPEIILIYHDRYFWYLPASIFTSAHELSWHVFRVTFLTSLTHWSRVTHICVGNLTTIGPDNGFSPGRRQATIWTNAGILLIGPWGTNFSEILIGIQIFLFNKMHLKMLSAKWRPFCLGLNRYSLCSV